MFYSIINHMIAKITPFSDSIEGILLGSILGDGSLTLNKGYVSPRFSFRHSLKQLEYFNWKVEMLKDISSERSTWNQITNDNEFSREGEVKLRFQSRALPELTKLYKLVSVGNRKVIKRKFLNLLSPISLAIWWMDDGSIISNQRKGVFCTDSFSLKEIEILQRYLKVVWDVNTNIGNTSKSNFGSRRYVRLFISSTEELKKFFRIILPFIKVKEMLYKTLILYKEPNLQKRWISEVTDLSGFDRALIENLVSQRKVSLKSYKL